MATDNRDEAMRRLKLITDFVHKIRSREKGGTSGMVECLVCDSILRWELNEKGECSGVCLNRKVRCISWAPVGEDAFKT